MSEEPPEEVQTEDRTADIERRAAKLFEQMEGNPKRLALLAAQFQRFAEGAQPEMLEVVGGVSAMTGQPFVTFNFGGEYSIQQSPDEAYETARNVWEAAVNATYESALFQFLQEQLGIDKERSAMVISDMRDFRRDRWGKPPESDSQEKHVS